MTSLAVASAGEERSAAEGSVVSATIGAEDAAIADSDCADCAVGSGGGVPKRAGSEFNALETCEKGERKGATDSRPASNVLASGCGCSWEGAWLLMTVTADVASLGAAESRQATPTALIQPMSSQFFRLEIQKYRNSAQMNYKTSKSIVADLWSSIIHSRIRLVFSLWAQISEKSNSSKFEVASESTFCISTNDSNRRLIDP